MKAENLRGILIFVRAKLQKSHHINIFYTGPTGNLADNIPSYLHISIAMGNRLLWQQRDISISQLSEGVESPDLV